MRSVPTKFAASIQSNKHVVSQAERLQQNFQYVYASMFMLDTDDQNERFGRKKLVPFQFNSTG